MISKAFAEFFIERHACDGQFIKMARAMGLENAAKPEDFITATYEITGRVRRIRLENEQLWICPDEAMTLAKGARFMQGGLFAANPCGNDRRGLRRNFLKNLIANKSPDDRR